MSTNYKKLGDIVELIDERNKDGKVQNLIGVSIDKCFIKSVANTIGTDLTKYQVIRKNDFACSLMQVSRDGKIPIACLKDYDEAIMSPAYYIFRIRNTNEVLPDYLAMWFMRTEFDREASYIAVGGVRGSMPWEDFCDMKLPVPDLKEQEKIVNTYNAITKRIQLKQKINENLEKTAQCLFEKMWKSDECIEVELSELADVTSSKRVFFDEYVSEGIPFYRGGEITEKRQGFPISNPLYITEESYNEKIEKYGFDGKQLSHCVRLNDFLYKYVNGCCIADCFDADNKQELMNYKKQLVKDGSRVMTKEEAIELCAATDQATAALKDMVINSHEEKVDYEVINFLNGIKYDILKKKFKEDIWLARKR